VLGQAIVAIDLNLQSTGSSTPCQYSITGPLGTAVLGTATSDLTSSANYHIRPVIHVSLVRLQVSTLGIEWAAYAYGQRNNITIAAATPSYLFGAI